jgi:transcription elongation factor GreA
MVSRRTYLTPEGRRNLDKELKHLMTVRRREVAARIHRATEAGGTADNAEYEEAKNEQAFVEGRISELDRTLSNAVVEDSKNGDDGVIKFGSSVTVTTDKGQKRSYKVVGSAEAAPLEGKISLESPVGRSLMGRSIGEEVDIETPAGVISLKIRKIE